MTDEARWREVVDEVMAAFGRLDILVNSAGSRPSAISRRRRSPTFARSARSTPRAYSATPQAVRAMKESGRPIVNLSSVAGIIGDASSLAYCASKGAVRLLTKSAALHCARARYGIRVNSVHPSFAETPMVLDGIARARDPERLRAGLDAPRRWAAWARRRRSRTRSSFSPATSCRSPPAPSSWSMEASRRSKAQNGAMMAAARRPLPAERYKPVLTEVPSPRL